MTLKSPLLPHHRARGASTIPYADPRDPGRAAEVVETFGALETEYAALRKGCALFDLPHRGVVLVRGADRLDFLNRMVTQELRDLAPWRARHSFWLNRKGRIDADLRVTNLEDHLRLELDVHAAGRTIEALTSYLFTEDVAFDNAAEELHRLALHGPAAILLLAAVGEPVAGPAIEGLADLEACRVRIAGREVLVERDDACGEIGLELTCLAAGAADVYQALRDAGEAPTPGAGAPRPTELSARARLRPAGWHAFNIARIETGTPLFNLDFGEDNLPHETGVLRDRVSFKKGCYLGQEVVARMESLGQPKQKLVALRFEEEADPELPQPVSGADVAPANEPGKSCGHVTSSTISPMLGAVPVCFAMVRTAHAAPGTRLSVAAHTTRIGATVQPQLAFYRRGG